MISFYKRIKDLYNAEGSEVFFEKVMGNLLYYPAAIVFIFVNSIVKTDENTVLLRLRRSRIDADRLSLLKSFSEENEDVKIHLAVWSRTIYEENSTVYQDVIDKYDIEVVRVHSFRFVLALAESSIVNFCHETDFLLYRRFDTCKEKTYLRTYHGIAVKGDTPSQSRRSLPFLPHPRVDFRPVSSDLELYTRAALENRDVREYDKIGYPRFDRIYELIREETSPVLTDESCEILESNSNYKVLYAPTHQTKAKLYNLPCFELERLEEFLSTTGIELYLRMHTNEEGWITEDLTELDHVTYAGRSFSGSSIEILPYMDALITDFSSIYMEFLPFDRPVVFIEDNEFMERKGIRYDYDRYYPGEKVRTFDQLTTHLRKCKEWGDSYAEDRKFVRKSFEIDSGPKFNSMIQ